ncbi:hypothetical protein [Desertivirga xinjiangensis]|uniref:hypothetical protein n=1 Tax=Desertivirga xinjiangensis TaxID=539206 RepID=UPI00210EF88C|nr:hypothetical protein [Pedobacter xinjiangensis]
MIDEENTQKKTNDDGNEHRDQIGENTGHDTELSREIKTDQHQQENSDSSNKQKGPAGENL